MNTIKNLISTVALLAASTLFAQNSNVAPWFNKASEDGPGVIGKRYVDAGFGLQDPQEYSDVAEAYGLAVNVPLNRNLDVGLSYSYSTLNYTPQGALPGEAIDANSHSIGTYATVYNTIEKGIKPFLSVNLGTSASSRDFMGGDHGTNYQWWGLSAGAEFPSKWVSVIASLSYDDDFKRSEFSNQSWTVKTEVNTWITTKIAGYVGFAYTDPAHNYVNSWTYTIGARLRF
jgi:hypothetical protein